MVHLYQQYKNKEWAAGISKEQMYQVFHCFTEDKFFFKEKEEFALIELKLEEIKKKQSRYLNQASENTDSYMGDLSTPLGTARSPVGDCDQLSAEDLDEDLKSNPNVIKDFFGAKTARTILNKLQNFQKTLQIKTNLSPDNYAILSDSDSVLSNWNTPPQQDDKTSRQELQEEDPVRQDPHRCAAATQATNQDNANAGSQSSR